MQNKTFWASRDEKTTTSIGSNDGMKNHIKIWDKEPTYTRPNGVFAGKIFMGMFDVSEWEGPEILPGEAKEIKITFKGV